MLSQLPGNLRSEIVQNIYEDTLLVCCPIFSKTSRECATQLLLRLTPVAYLQGEVVYSPRQLTDAVFILMRGSLSVSLGGDGAEPAGAGPPSPGAKGAGKFTVIERQGAVLGGDALFANSPPRYPFYVVSTKASQLVSIGVGDLESILSIFVGDDCDTVVAQLAKEHKALLDATRPKGGKEAPKEEASPTGEGKGRRRTSNVPGEDRTAGELSTSELRERVLRLEKQLEDAAGDLVQVKSDLAALPKILKLLAGAAA